MKKSKTTTVLIQAYIQCFASLLIVLTSINYSFAQRVKSLVPEISVDSLLFTKPGATKIARETTSGNLFYTTVNGNIYEVYIPTVGKATDILRYTASDHGITYLQGLYFRDSAMYLCGNIWSASTGIGKVVKGVLQKNGKRIWTDIVTTNPYPSANSTGDHGFAGINIDPIGNYIYVSSGARTHLGEIRTNNGIWEGKREVPLTTKIFRFPLNAINIMLPNDSSLLEKSGYIFVSGTRNAYDMAWDGNNNLFAIDNSGERDDPEELNWLRAGRHYGYPWRMGGNDNPLRQSPYDASKDILVNKKSGGYLSGWLADDPTFPKAPKNTVFTEPIRNYGTAADYFKDPVTGKILKASDKATYISSFTAHRSPLGLVIDRDSFLAPSYRGNAFVLSFMPGGDSDGYTPLSPWGSPCPFVDPSRELVQMKLTYNTSLDDYTMTTSNLVTGFYLPVDAELFKNKLYVIENGGYIWQLTFPNNSSAIEEIPLVTKIDAYPNPFNQTTTLNFEDLEKGLYSLMVYNAMGQKVREFKDVSNEKINFDRKNLSNGVYLIQLQSAGKIYAQGKIVIE